ncbi:hypothetical protein DK37_05515 [Halomonas sp. SUBG004]|nr:hypothetical protein DK37_05515 [Halomonas sp. SUBG004]
MKLSPPQRTAHETSKEQVYDKQIKLFRNSSGPLRPLPTQCVFNAKTRQRARVRIDPYFKGPTPATSAFIEMMG